MARNNGYYSRLKNDGNNREDDENESYYDRISGGTTVAERRNNNTYYNQIKNSSSNENTNTDFRTNGNWNNWRKDREQENYNAAKSLYGNTKNDYLSNAKSSSYLEDEAYKAREEALNLLNTMQNRTSSVADEIDNAINQNNYGYINNRTNTQNTVNNAINQNNYGYLNNNNTLTADEVDRVTAQEQANLNEFAAPMARVTELNNRADRLEREARDQLYKEIPEMEDFNANNGYARRDPEYVNGDIAGNFRKFAAFTNNTTNLDYMNGMNPGQGQDKPFGYNRFDYATDQERQIYNYLYNTRNEEEADRYLDTLNLSERMTQSVVEEEQKWASENPVAWSLQSGSYNVLGGLTALGENIGTKLAGRELDPNSEGNLLLNISRGTRSQIGQDTADNVNNAEWVNGLVNKAEEMLGADNKFAQSLRQAQEDGTFGNIANTIYQGGMSAYDSALNMGLSGGSSGFNSLLVGSQVGSNAIIEAKERGLSDEQAILTGVAFAAVEALTEKYSVEALFNAEPSTIRAYIARNFITEGSEEAAADIVDWIADGIINADQSEFEQNIQGYVNDGMTYQQAYQRAFKDNVMQVIEDAAIGGVTGAGFGAVGGAGRAINNYSVGKHVNSAEENARNQIINVATQSSDENTRLLAEKAAEGGLSNYEMGRLVEQVSNEFGIRQSIKEAIMDEGISESKAETLTDTVIRYISGQELTEKEQRIVDNNKTVKNTIDRIANGDFDAAYERQNAFNDALDMALNRKAQNNTENVQETTNNVQNNAASTQNNENNNKVDNSTNETKNVPKLSEYAQIRNEINAFVEDQDIKNVSNTSNGMEIELKNGNTVSVKDAKFADSNTQRIYEKAAGLYSTEEQKAYIANYEEVKESVPVNSYDRMYNIFYDGGVNGQDYEQLKEKIPNSAKYYLNNAPGMNVAMRSAYEMGKKWEGKAEAARASKTAQKVVNRLANIVGVEVVYTNEEDNVNGYMKDNKIYISKHSDKSIVSVFSHELTHWLKNNSPEQYVKYEKHVIQYLKDIGEYEKVLANKKRLYGEISEADLMEEIAADGSETFLLDEKTINKIVREDKKLAEKIVEFINKVIDELKDMFGLYSPKSMEARLLEEDIETWEEARDLWVEAINNIEENEKENNNVKNSLKENEEDEIHKELYRSLTMGQAKNMFERVYNSEIKPYYDEYKTVDQWINESSEDEIGMYIENDYNIQNIYLSKIRPYIDGDLYIEDIVSAYKENKYTGKVKEKTTNKIVSENVVVYDNRYYAPQKIENAKAIYEIASKKLNNSNREEVTKARAQILLYAHNKGAAETLGLTDAELNKKIKSWTGYTAKAKEISMRINDNVAFSNRWTGIENLSWICQHNVTDEEFNRMVKEVEGNVGTLERNYISRTMMAYDTHIDWSWLSFKFGSIEEINKNVTGNKYVKVAAGYYQDNERLIVAKPSGETIAHEMSHALDHQWGRDFGKTYAFTEYVSRISSEELNGMDENKKHFIEGFREFMTGLYEKSDIRNEYYGDPKETFARFGAKFVEWTEKIANNGNGIVNEFVYNNDKFTQADYVAFARLLQEKAALDTNGLTNNKINKQDVKYSRKDIISKYIPEQFKNNNKKFSLKEPVETKGDLIALHSLNESKLLQTLDLGGFPMPSIAVTKPDIKWGAKGGGFGEITAIFSKDTIDPKKDKNNKVYSADAWTPTFPSVSAKISENAVKDINKKLDSILDRSIAEELGGYKIDNSNTPDIADRYGDLAVGYNNNAALMYAYLKDTGKEIELPTKEENYSNKHPNNAIKAISGISNLKEVESMRMNIYNYFENNPDKVEEFREAINGYYNSIAKSERSALYNLYPAEDFGFADFDELTRGLYRYYRMGSQQKVDYYEAKNVISKEIDKTEFEKWLNNLFKDAVEKKGIRNNKDLFTPSGKRRNWEDLHDLITLENVVKNMKSQQKTGGGIFGSSLSGSATREYKTIEEVKSDRNRISENADELKSELMNKYENDFSELIDSIQKTSSNALSNMQYRDTAREILLETMQKAKTLAGMQRNLSKEAAYINLQEDTAQKLFDLYKGIESLPTDYFEAKPERAVGFDEVVKMVIPNNTSEELIEKLNERNIGYITYEAGNMDDRTEKVNSINEAKFSIKDYSDRMGLKFSASEFDLFMEAYDEYEESTAGQMAQNTASILEEGFEYLKQLKDEKKVKFTHADAERIAKKYQKEYNSKQGIEFTANNIEAIFAYIQQNDVNYDDMLRVMKEVCEPMVENSKGNTEWTKQFDDFRSYLKDMPISLNEQQKKEVAYTYGSYSNFKKAAAGIINIKDDGVNIDNVWNEICQKSGYYLNTEENSNTQAIALVEAVNEMRDGTVTEHNGMTMEQLAYDMALHVYTDYFRLLSEKNEGAGKYKDELEKQIKKYQREVEQKYKNMLGQVQADNAKRIQDLEKKFRQQKKEYETTRSEEVAEEVARLRVQIDRLKKQNNDKVAQIKAEHKESKLKEAERRQTTKLKNQIRNIVADLQRRLTNPTQTHHVPSDLIKATIDVCNAINLDTGRSEKLAEKFARLKDTYEAVKKEYGDKDAADYDEYTYNQITRLKNIFENRNITEISKEDLEDVLTTIKAIQTQIRNENKLLNSKIKMDQYEAGYKIIEDVRASKGVGNAKAQRYFSKYVMTTQNAPRFFRMVSGYKTNAMLDQLYEDLNEGSHEAMEVERIVDRIMKPAIEGKKMKQAEKMVSANQKDWIETGWKDRKGKPIKISEAMRVSLALHMQNEDNMKHIIYGGLTIPDAKLYGQGDIKEAYAKGTTIRFINRQGLSGLMDKIMDPDITIAERENYQQQYARSIKQQYDNAVAQIKQVVDGMTDYEREFLKCAEEYFHEYSGQKINETSMILNGYKKAVVENYFPIRTDKAYTRSEMEGVKFDATIEGWGSLKSRIHGSNPIVLESIDKVIQSHSSMLQKYVGLAIPIRNFNKVYNVTLKGNTDAVKAAIGEKWGTSATEYINNLITDLQTTRRNNDMFSRAMNKLRGNFAQSTLAMNISVAWKQAASFPTAAYSLGWDAMGKTLFSKSGANLIGAMAAPFHLSKETKKIMETAEAFTPILYYRNKGNSTQEFGDLKQTTTVIDRIPGVNKLTEKLMNWIQNIDTTTVATLWKAAENKVSMETNLKKGTAKYYEEVAKVFNKAVEDTQPNYTVLQRPDILRNPNEFLAQIFMFKTQPLQNLGIVSDSIMELEAKTKAYKENQNDTTKVELQRSKEKFARAISSQTVAALVFAGMTMAANAFMHRMDRYRDKDKELTLESIASRFINDVFSCFAGALPLGSEIYDFVQSKVTGNQYYGLQVSTVEMINDFVTHLNKVFTANSDSARIKALEQVIMDASGIAGVPLENAKKLVKGFVLWGTDFALNQPGTFEAGVERTNSVNYSRIYEAMLNSDVEKTESVYDELIENGVDPEDIYSLNGAGKYVKEDYLAGNYDDQTAESYLRTLGMSEEAAAEKVNEWWTENLRDNVLAGSVSQDDAVNELVARGMETTEAYKKVYNWINETSGTYAPIYDAIRTHNNETVQAAIDEMLANGYTMDNIKNADITGKFQDEYIELYSTDKTKAAELKNTLVSFYMRTGMTKKDAMAKIDSWIS